MNTHTFEIKERDWQASKFRTRGWEKRVNIVRWEHDYENEMYFITIKTK
jgi:hypothetical protein